MSIMQRKIAISLMYEREDTGPEDQPHWVKRLYGGGCSWSDVASGLNARDNGSTAMQAGCVAPYYADAADVIDITPHGGFYVRPYQSHANAVWAAVDRCLRDWHEQALHTFAEWLEENEGCDVCGGHADLDRCVCDDDDDGV